MSAHAKYRAPSAAHRWLSCHASAFIVPQYPNEESEASLKGTLAHDLLDNGITFGIQPDTDDPDMDLNVRDVLKWVKDTVKSYGPGTKVYAEQQFDIPQTGEIGTGDVTIVSPKVLHIGDYKDGYVPVNVKMNPQLLLYLLGAIAKYGQRSKYLISVFQPNYDHVDGPIRTFEVSAENLEWFEIEVKSAMAEGAEDRFAAGAHCKATYCPHRGACVTFMAWARTDASKAWFPGEQNGLDHVQLAQALDHSDTLQGIRDELRKEAMRRIMQQDAEIPGYKVCKSRVNREFKGDEGRAACYIALLQMGYTEGDLVHKEPLQVGGVTLYEQKALTVPDVERMVKQQYKNFGRGKWKEVWDEYIQPHIRTESGSLTLTRAIDGRPAHTRGSEFGPITPPAQVGQVGQVNII